MTSQFRPAGMSEDDSEEEFDFGFKIIAKCSNKRRKKAASCSKETLPVSQKSSSASEKKMSFWEKKQLAFERFGETTIRPQEQYREFLLHRRQINIGTYVQRWAENSQLTEIRTSQFPLDNLLIDSSKILPEVYNNPLIIVNNSDSFSEMIGHLWEQEEIAIDLEANLDHSFIGMTVLIQIATKQKDYLVDVFPVNKLIIEDLKSVLESPNILKYTFGGDNDVLWLKRDFFIDSVHVIDVQTLIQEILSHDKLEELLKNIPMEAKKPWYHEFIGKRDNATTKIELSELEKRAAKEPLGFDALCKLFYPDVEVDKVAQLADFRPRARATSAYQKLLKYARDDVHLLLRIVSFIKGNLSIESAKSTFTSAYEKSKSKLVKCFKPSFPAIHPPSSKTQQGSINTSEQLQLYQVIYKWRRLHASIIDESTQAMITDQQIFSLIKDKPVKIEDIAIRLKGQHGNSRVPESIGSWEKTLFELLHVGKSYYDKIMTVQCHNCRKCLGHAAWGCPEPWSSENNKLNLKENPEMKNRQNRRRQQNKRRNKRLKNNQQ